MNNLANVGPQPEVDLASKTALFYCLVFLSAVVGGVIVSTGKLIPLVMFVGGVTALSLMFRPVVLLWVVTFITLIFAGTIAYLIPSLHKIWWAGYILAFILYVPALLDFLILQNRKSRIQQNSRMIYPLLVFVSICGLSTLVNPAPFEIAVLAVKSMFLYGGVWAALSLINFSSTFIQRWLLVLLGIGLIQTIPSLYQYLFVRSARISAGLGDVTASDSVVGTFGGSMVSGGSGPVLALYLIILIVCLLSFRRASLITRNDLLWMVSLLALPLLLMEVKVIFVYLPIAFAVLYSDVLKNRPIAFITGGILIISICVILLAAYQMLHWSARDSGSFVENTTHHLSYSFNDKSQSENSTGRMTRLQVLTFWWENHDMDKPMPMLIGHGLGASRTEGLKVGHIAKQYAPIEIDGTGLALLLWDVGLLGTSAFLLLLFSAFKHAHRLSQLQTLEDWQRALAIGLKVAMILIIISLPYINDIPYAAQMMFILAAILGLLEWLHKQQEQVS